MSVHKIALEGCGGMSNVWFDYIEQRENAEIAALVDLNPVMTRKKSEERNLDVPLFRDPETAIKETEANLVFDVTIPAAHKHIAATALKQGCHVFGERPMAETLQDAEDIIQQVQRARRNGMDLTNWKQKLFNLLSNKLFLVI